MEALFILVGLAALAVPVIGLILGIRAENAVGRLQTRLASIEGELAALRQRPAPGAPQAEPPQPDPKRAWPQGTPEPEKADAREPEGPQPKGPQPKGPEPEGAPSAWPDTPHAAPRRRRSYEDIERALGARWSVILGGIAVALGAVFLVRYSIEAGLLGPKARIGAGAAFSVALFAAGEWLRRRDRKLAIAALGDADIPGILTGAGAIGAFATVYSAHALYGFIGPGIAFVALTAVGIASLLLSAVHGPKLAALGVVGAYGAPALVSSQSPEPLALAAHVLVVTASVLGVARLRNWLWLAIAGVAGGAGWTAMASGISSVNNAIAGMALLVGLGLLFAAAFLWRKSPMSSPSAAMEPDLPAIGAFAALTLAFLVQLLGNDHLPVVAAAVALSLIAAGVAANWPGASPVALAATIMALAGLQRLQLFPQIEPGVTNNDAIRYGLVVTDVAAFLRQSAAISVPAFAALIAGAWRYGARERGPAGFVSAAAALLGVLTLVAAYLRTAPLETRPAFGAAGLALAFLFGAMTERFARLDSADVNAPAPAAFAVAGVAALSFAISVSLDTGWFPLSFALAALGIAWIHGFRPVAALPWLAAAASLAGAASLWLSLPFPGEMIGAAPFLNRLILLVGLPAAALVATGELLRRRAVAIPGALAGAAGLALAGLFAGLEIRHWITGGEIASHQWDLAEVATQTLAAFGFAAGLQRAGQKTGAALYRNASVVAGAISAAMAAFGLLLLRNPLFTDLFVVGERAVANLLLPAYLMTGIAAGALALHGRSVRPRWYTLSFAALSGLLLFAFASLTVRHAFHGDAMAIWHSTSQAEYWTYSAIWLALGAAVLAAGSWLKSRPIRFASALLIGLTVCKVFLLDLANLEGALRAFSFIGLGLSLLAIGRFYQRVLLAPPDPASGADKAGT
jgi:uncharacterized membrane protein